MPLHGTLAPDNTDSEIKSLQKINELLLNLYQNAGSSGSVGTVFSSVQTAATGTNWTALGSQACDQVEIVGVAWSGTTKVDDIDFEVRKTASPGEVYRISSGTAVLFRGFANVDELQIRRVDTSNTQVTVYWRAEV